MCMSLMQMCSNRYMQVNSDTMRQVERLSSVLCPTNRSNRSLCIFESERHPNMHQMQGKESLSLFGMAWYIRGLIQV